MERDIGPVAEVEGRLHGAHEDRPAVRVDGMVPRVGRVEEVGDSARDGPGRCHGEEDHVPVRDHGLLHRLLGVVPFGDLPGVPCQAGRGDLV